MLSNYLALSSLMCGHACTPLCKHTHTHTHMHACSCMYIQTYVCSDTFIGHFTLILSEGNYALVRNNILNDSQGS
jgi:hypothetical protein